MAEKKNNLNYYNIYIIDLINFINKKFHLNYLNNHIIVFLKNRILKKNKDNQKKNNIEEYNEYDEKVNDICDLILMSNNSKTKFNKNTLYAFLWKSILNLDNTIKTKYKKINETIKSYEDYIYMVKKINNTFIDLYVDGSYRETEKKYSYGLVVVENENIIYEKCKIKNEPNNYNLKHIAGELCAVIEGIRYIKWKKIKKIRLYYDFEGIADLVLLPRCKPHNETTKRYQEFMKNYINKTDIEIIFIKVKSHSGNKYNDKVHSLCNTAFYKKRNVY